MSVMVRYSHVHESTNVSSYAAAPSVNVFPTQHVPRGVQDFQATPVMMPSRILAAAVEAGLSFTPSALGTLGLAQRALAQAATPPNSAGMLQPTSSPPSSC